VTKIGIVITTGRLLSETEKQRFLASLRAKAVQAERCGLPRTAAWWRTAIENLNSGQRVLAQVRE
jgi:hypothetical protein